MVLRRFSNPALAALSRVFFALFAIAQVAPPGVAFAADDQGDLTVVVCTAHGSQTVLLSELTGEPAPESEDDSRSCTACMTTCRVGVDVSPTTIAAPLSPAPQAAAAHSESRLATILYVTRPPMPSRAPPHA
jgi:hypothetical protein